MHIKERISQSLLWENLCWESRSKRGNKGTGDIAGLLFPWKSQSLVQIAGGSTTDSCCWDPHGWNCVFCRVVEPATVLALEWLYLGAQQLWGTKWSKIICQGFCLLGAPQAPDTTGFPTSLLSHVFLQVANNGFGLPIRLLPWRLGKSCVPCLCPERKVPNTLATKSGISSRCSTGMATGIQASPSGLWVMSQ